ncbi:hypothetical protein [Sphingobium sp. AP50]|uniref:hypothetical protein n=1 Tax=Sphingobium sp. AP50 TaxID=1884369 RepID=UPI001160505A|nr:hypothetical protein [Sphingobium sp. AP50]
MNGFFSGMSFRAQLAGWSMIAAAMIVPMFLMVVLGRSEPIDRISVYGCYAAPNAPALLIRDDAIHIIEPAKRKFSYVAGASKTSYQLSVKPALALSRQPDGRYIFVDRDGVGYFWPLLPANGKNRNRVRHPEEYAGQFKVAAIGGTVLYTRTAEPHACRDDF